MKSNRSIMVLSFLLLAGALVALTWVWRADAEALIRTLLGAGALPMLTCLGLTASWHFIRFVRWQFLLRRVDVRVPARSALRIYMAGGLGTATPAYAGEGLRSFLLSRRYRVPYQASLPVLVLERIQDVAALAILLLLLATSRKDTVLATGMVLAAGVMGWLLYRVARTLGLAVAITATLRSPSAWLLGLLGSLAAWGLAGAILGICAASLDLDTSFADGARIYFATTLLGGLTLLPAGVGVTGSLAILRLMDLGTPLTGAVAAVSLLRFLTVGVSLLVGTVFLIREISPLKNRPRKSHAGHFDQLNEQYRNQFPAHIWDHLMARKIALIREVIGQIPVGTKAGWGLDVGCGVAAHTAALSARGYNIVGLDPALGLLRQAPANGKIPLLQADARSLPFLDGSIDFIYTIGVLHHLDDASDLDRVLGEARRVLRPGGRFIVVETNPLNPVFRFYMGYVFPLVRRIDEGVERWIEPSSWEEQDGLKLTHLKHFTFLPDFLPRWLMQPVLGLERTLEESRIQRLSVHYMAVMERIDA